MTAPLPARRLWECQEFIAKVPLLEPMKKFEKDRLACFLHTAEFAANEVGAVPASVLPALPPRERPSVNLVHACRSS